MPACSHIRLANGRGVLHTTAYRRTQLHSTACGCNDTSHTAPYRCVQLQINSVQLSNAEFCCAWAQNTARDFIGWWHAAYGRMQSCVVADGRTCVLRTCVLPLITVYCHTLLYVSCNEIYRLGALTRWGNHWSGIKRKGRKKTSKPPWGFRVVSGFSHGRSKRYLFTLNAPTDAIHATAAKGFSRGRPKRCLFRPNCPSDAKTDNYHSRHQSWHLDVSFLRD